MATAPKVDMDEFISVDEVIVAPRGRKANLDEDFVKSIGKLQVGQAAVVKRFGNPSPAQRPGVSQKIRQHWTAAGRTEDLRIDYRPTDGFPQVRIKVPAEG